MDFNVKDFDIKGKITCDCGHEFTMKDFIELKTINHAGFYGNIVKYYSPSKCPECNKDTILLLQQAGQTYKIIDIATKKQQNECTEPTKQIEKEIETVQEFICPECKKVCKNQLGLNAHLRTHQI